MSGSVGVFTTGADEGGMSISQQSKNTFSIVGQQSSAKSSAAHKGYAEQRASRTVGTRLSKVVSAADGANDCDEAKGMATAARAKKRQIFMVLEMQRCNLCFVVKLRCNNDSGRMHSLHEAQIFAFESHPPRFLSFLVGVANTINAKNRQT
jgi:hypothetical protein